jgi:hypothetical protein
MALEIAGKLVQVQPEVTGTGKNGNWVKQDFIIETVNEQFPKKVCFTVWGDKTQILKSLKPGMQLNVSFNLESREYNGKWYSDIKAWKIDVNPNASQSENAEPINSSSYNDLSLDAGNGSKDDLPF